MYSWVLLLFPLLLGATPIPGSAAPCADSYAFMDSRPLPASQALSFPSDYLTVEAIGPRGERLRYPGKIVERFIETDRESKLRILVYHRGKRQLIEARLRWRMSPSSSHSGVRRKSRTSIGGIRIE
jgi:hypothetical protein